MKALGHWREISRKIRKLPDHATHRHTYFTLVVAVVAPKTVFVELGVSKVTRTIDRARHVVAFTPIERIVPDSTCADKVEWRSADIIKAIGSITKVVVTGPNCTNATRNPKVRKLEGSQGA